MIHTDIPTDWLERRVALYMTDYGLSEEDAHIAASDDWIALLDRSC